MPRAGLIDNLISLRIWKCLTGTCHGRFGFYFQFNLAVKNLKILPRALAAEKHAH
jgi:hypothetical protein